MFEIYTVSPGDTIETISDSFNISPSNLYKLNGFTPDYLLEEGKNIIVPKLTNDYFTYYTIKKGDTISKIAKEYNVNTKLLSILNGLNTQDYIYPNQTIVVPQKDVSIYITGNKDTINEIIKGINANTSDLLKQNPNIYVMPEQLIVYKQN